jgi:hypothetical protein
VYGGEYADTAWSPIGLGRNDQGVARPRPLPTVGDRPARLDCGQAVAEAVRGDQHPQSRRGRPSGHSSRVGLRVSHRMPHCYRGEVTWQM